MSSVVAAKLSERFESDEFLERVSHENPSMLTKIKDFIKDVIKRLSEAQARAERAEERMRPRVLEKE